MIFWPVEKYWLKSFIMAMPSPLLINSFNSSLIITYVVFCWWPEVFLAGLQQETAFSEAKTKVSHRCGLNYILLRFQHINISLLISCVNTDVRIAYKECIEIRFCLQKSDILEISSKEAGRREDRADRKTPGTEKLKLILISKINGWKEW